MGVDSALVDARAEKLLYYSPYNFLRNVSAITQQKLFGKGLAASFGENSQQKIFTVNGVQFLYSFLPWDSDFFGASIYKLFTVIYTANSTAQEVAIAVKAFLLYTKEINCAYLFIDIPIEDTLLIQALGIAGWRMVESRLNFYYDTISDFKYAQFPTRKAAPEEAELIGHISATARNEYDRFHADEWFGNTRADAFLHRYATAAVEGYCDTVLVPNEPDLVIDSFLAIDDAPIHAAKLGFRASRIVLTAVGPANRGWHLKLAAATIHRAREMQANYVLMTTQATNRAVFRTCEKLGFKLGSTSCILSYANNLISSVQ
ncbi:hypothetical protein MUN82_13510 [Hymenobacter aerilatus]|uniref:Uncharacterized protein n=1 Tax=Hymenobacter aerilatus TaxID=2932251 RepID=A0A8T9SPI2_9BACT|nr:hypothetical protein [Hymenobacter aerilatus]UOR03962.1 hypothetical protein MUN82_13510 [Hymenobacter aerilatus]